MSNTRKRRYRLRFLVTVVLPLNGCSSPEMQWGGVRAEKEESDLNQKQTTNLGVDVLDDGEHVDDVVLAEGRLCLAVHVVLAQQHLHTQLLAEGPQQRHLLQQVALHCRVHTITARETSKC